MSEDYPTSIRVGLRLARDRLGSLDRSLTAISAAFNASNTMASDSHMRENQATCLDCFNEAAEVLILELINRKQERAKNRRDELSRALRELADDVAASFEGHNGTPLYRRPEAAHADFDAALLQTIERILLDFDDEVYHHMGKNDRHGDSITIHNAGNLAGNIGRGAKGDIQATQSFNDAALFDDLSRAIESQVKDAVERERLLAAVHRMQSSANDKGALWRAYSEFVSATASHLTIVSPYLPALANLFAP